MLYAFPTFTYSGNIVLTRYQLVVLSDNYYLWSGLRHCIPFMVEPHLALSWHKDLTGEDLFLLREKILQDTSGKKWLIVTGHKRMQELQQLLPPGKVCLIRDNVSLKQLACHLRHPDFHRRIEKDAPLTQTEAHVCRLIIKGLSTVKIAEMMNKSPKTVYTHRRNAMTKFHCHTLADLHRKMHLMAHRNA